jgi:hypothetical protein
MKYRLPPIVPPWSFFPGFGEFSESNQIVGGDGVPFAWAFRWLGDATEEGEANARAIAAVPALLHALVECEAALHLRHASTGINSADYAALQSARIALELAGCVPVSSECRSISPGGNHVAYPVQVVRS